MRGIMIAFLLVWASSAAAVEFVYTGVGGGGWLQSGAFHPTDDQIMLVGTDITGGIYRTDDRGVSWEVWNEGLANDWYGDANYVDDLLGIVEPSGEVAFYAATYGGIYRASEFGPWVLETDPETYNYRAAFYTENEDGTITPQSWRNFRQPISFSCMTYEPKNQMLFAGAGRVRYESDYEIDYYPGLPSEFFGSCDLTLGVQQSVWVKDLSDTGSGEWEMFLDDQGAPAEFGSPRSISATKIRNTMWVAVSTPTGVYLYNGSEWIPLGDLPVSADKDLLEGPVYGQDYTGWSIHVTARGVLYLAVMKLEEDATSTLASGVYMIEDIENPDAWKWVGDYGSHLDPKQDTTSLYDHGRDPYQKFIYLSVVEGKLSEPDILYLGDRSPRFGLAVGEQAFDRSGPLLRSCNWESLVYTLDTDGDNYREYYWRSADAVDGDVTEWDSQMSGWADIYGIGVLFEPALAPQNPTQTVGLQFATRFHITDDGGQSWQNAYCSGVDGSWTTAGYNELCVRDIEFLPDGRIFEATADCGIFLANDRYNREFDWLTAPYSYTATGTDDFSTSFSTDDCAVRADWNGTGETRLFTVVGRPLQMGTPCKLFMISGDGPGTWQWENITKNLPDPDRYQINDFCFKDDTTIFLSYKKMNVKAGTEDAYVVECGVIKLEYADETWNPTIWNEGFEDFYGGFHNGEEIIYNEPANTVLLATKLGSVADGVGTSVSTRGAIYARVDEAGSEWQGVIYGNSSWLDFRCIAQSANGGVIYAGTRGLSGGVGGVLRFPNALDLSVWAPIANGPEDGNTFGIPDPPAPAAEWVADPVTYYKTQTYVNCIAVDPLCQDCIQVGLTMNGFQKSEGLWSWDSVNGWANRSEGYPWEGVGVDCVKYHVTDTEKFLAFGTSGQELYYQVAARRDVPPDDDPIEDPTDPGLQMRITASPDRRGGATTVQFSLARSATVELEVFDVRGRLVWNVTTEPLGVGQHQLTWPGVQAGGAKVASGIYLARLRAGGESLTGKMVLVR